MKRDIETTSGINHEMDAGGDDNSSKPGIMRPRKERKGYRRTVTIALLLVTSSALALATYVAAVARRSKNAVDRNNEGWAYLQGFMTFSPESDGSGHCWVENRTVPIAVDWWNSTHVSTSHETVPFTHKDCGRFTENRRLGRPSSCPSGTQLCYSHDDCYMTGRQTSASANKLNHYGYIKGASRSTATNANRMDAALEGRFISKNKFGYAHCHVHSHAWLYVNDVDIRCKIDGRENDGYWNTVFWGAHVRAYSKCVVGSLESCCTPREMAGG